MASDKHIFKTALETEYQDINKTLAAFLGKGEPSYKTDSGLQASDLDRTEADTAMTNAVKKAPTATLEEKENIGLTFADYQEDQRIRRDTIIGRMGHKKLMRSCLETLYRRQLELYRKLYEPPGRPDYSSNTGSNIA